MAVLGMIPSDAAFMPCRFPEPKAMPRTGFSFPGTQSISRLDHRNLLPDDTRWAAALLAACRGDRLSHLDAEKIARSQAVSICRRTRRPAVRFPSTVFMGIILFGDGLGPKCDLQLTQWEHLAEYPNYYVAPNGFFLGVLR